MIVIEPDGPAEVGARICHRCLRVECSPACARRRVLEQAADPGGEAVAATDNPRLELGIIAEAVSLEGTILGLDGHEPSIAAGLQLAQALEAVRRAEGLAESAEVTRLRSAVSAAIAVIADAPADERYPARGLLHRILAALETAEAPSDG